MDSFRPLRADLDRHQLKEKFESLSRQGFTVERKTRSFFRGERWEPGSSSELAESFVDDPRDVRVSHPRLGELKVVDGGDLVELEALAVHDTSSLSSPELGEALETLERTGWRFMRENREVGAYGALNALTGDPNHPHEVQFAKGDERVTGDKVLAIAYLEGEEELAPQADPLARTIFEIKEAGLHLDGEAAWQTYLKASSETGAEVRHRDLAVGRLRNDSEARTFLEAARRLDAIRQEVTVSQELWDVLAQERGLPVELEAPLAAEMIEHRRKRTGELLDALARTEDPTKAAATLRELTRSSIGTDTVLAAFPRSLQLEPAQKDLYRFLLSREAPVDIDQTVTRFREVEPLQSFLSEKAQPVELLRALDPELPLERQLPVLEKIVELRPEQAPAIYARFRAGLREDEPPEQAFAPLEPLLATGLATPELFVAYDHLRELPTERHAFYHTVLAATDEPVTANTLAEGGQALESVYGKLVEHRPDAAHLLKHLVPAVAPEAIDTDTLLALTGEQETEQAARIYQQYLKTPAPDFSELLTLHGNDLAALDATLTTVDDLDAWRGLLAVVKDPRKTTELFQTTRDPKQLEAVLAHAPDLETGLEHLQRLGPTENALRLYRGDPEQAEALARRLARPRVPGSERPLEERVEAASMLLDAGALKSYDFLASRAEGPLDQAAQRLVSLLGSGLSETEARMAFVAVSEQPETSALFEKAVGLTGSFGAARPIVDAAAAVPDGPARLDAVEPLARGWRGLARPEQVAWLATGQIRAPLGGEGLTALGDILTAWYGAGGGETTGSTMMIPGRFQMPASGGLAMKLQSSVARAEASVDGRSWTALKAWGNGFVSTIGSDLAAQPGQQVFLRVRTDDENPQLFRELSFQVGTVEPTKTIKTYELQRHADYKTGEVTLESSYTSIPPGAQAEFFVDPTLGTGASAFFEISRGYSHGWDPLRSFSGYSRKDEKVDLSRYANDVVKFRFRITPSSNRYSTAEIRYSNIDLRREPTVTATIPALPPDEVTDRLLKLAYSDRPASERGANLQAVAGLAKSSGSLADALTLVETLEKTPAAKRVELGEALSVLVRAEGVDKGRELFGYLQGEVESDFVEHARLLAGRGVAEYERMLGRLHLETVDGNPRDALTLVSAVQERSGPSVADEVWNLVRVPVRDETLEERLRVFEGLAQEEALEIYRGLTQSLDPANTLPEAAAAHRTLAEACGDPQRGLELLGQVQTAQASGRFSGATLSELVTEAVKAFLAGEQDLEAALMREALRFADAGTIEVSDEQVRVGEHNLSINR